ncbi:MAG TPA: chemotaxis protein CheW [Methylomirabilota bacterium]|nr:chemotaxis protein CheW [Methylomirabilota bacterium]
MTTSLLDTSAVVRACVFMLGGEPFALDVARVREVVIFDEFTAVPLAPPHVIGLANLRGDVMPIVDAHGLLGLPLRRPGRAQRTLVVGADGLEIALVIDGVMSLEAFGEIVPVEEAAGRPCARWTLGFLKRDDLLVPLLDAEKVINALRPATARSSAA